MFSRSLSPLHVQGNYTKPRQKHCHPIESIDKLQHPTACRKEFERGEGADIEDDARVVLRQSSDLPSNEVGHLEIIDLSSTATVEILKSETSPKKFNSIIATTNIDFIVLSDYALDLINAFKTTTFSFQSLREILYTNGFRKNFDLIRHHDASFIEVTIRHFLDLVCSPKNPLTQNILERTTATYVVIHIVNQLFIANNNIIKLAKNDEDSKVITDEGKLSRETKDAVDSILTLIETAAQAFSAQISGITCLIATQQLIGNGLYVYHPAYSFSLPSCIEELGSFKSSMQKLLSFQQHVVITIANILEKAGTKKYLLNKQFGKHDEADKDGEATPNLNWRRDTFYTPPRNKEARVPLLLFGLPSSGLVSRLLKTKYSEGEEGVVYDQFGWWGKKNDKWHNKVTNETQDECPYSEE